MIVLPNPNARTARIILTTVSAVVVVSVAVAAAGLSWRIRGYHQTEPSLSHSASQSAPIDTQAAIALAPFGTAAVDDSGPATSLPLQLKGVFAASTDTHAIAFISVSGAAPVPVRIGEAVNGATLIAVRKDRVIISNGGRNEYLAFADPARSIDGTKPSGAVSIATPVNESTPLVPGVGLAPGNAPGNTPSATPPALPNVSEQAVLQRLDASPSPGGYTIGANAPPGLQQGDVIESVNGTKISDANAARAAFANAQASGSAQIQILRNGKRITLNVPLR